MAALGANDVRFMDVAAHAEDPVHYSFHRDSCESDGQWQLETIPRKEVLAWPDEGRPTDKESNKSLSVAKRIGYGVYLQLSSEGGHRFDPYHPHHPVFPNRGNRRRSKRGRFCGDLDAYFQRSRSLPTLTVSQAGSWPPVSASKNSVPGD